MLAAESSQVSVSERPFEHGADGSAIPRGRWWFRDLKTVYLVPAVVRTLS